MSLCLASTAILAAQIVDRQGLNLINRAPFLDCAHATTANILTKLPTSNHIDAHMATRQDRRMTRADKRLNAFAEKAEPGKCHTLNEIAEVMGITRERVRQIEMRAKKNFRNRLSRLLKAEGVTPEDIADMLALAKLE